jgi:hypothetical protein
MVNPQSAKGISMLKTATAITGQPKPETFLKISLASIGDDSPRLGATQTPFGATWRDSNQQNSIC